MTPKDPMNSTAKKRSGRTSQFTPEVRKKILQVIRAGNFQHVAAAYGGIDRKTLERWLARGKRETHGEYRNFWLAFQNAVAESEVELVLGIRGHAKADWRAAAFLLERGPARSRWRQPDVRDLTNGELQEIIDGLASRCSEGSSDEAGDSYPPSAVAAGEGAATAKPC